ncbi:cytochrome c oxidase subunit II [Caldimonas tepidiphila]|uniref:cytochrome c oxidase subunit II n=1 Tax=Caldimonas tepidiphila TaxID=2315841 RepID=UPI00196B9418|nr:cytochrome c oxidase subunit II [Caldimonas tepidiphila]
MAGLVAASAPLLGGCEGVQSTLHPAGPAARAISWLWWGMFAAFTAISIGVVALWLHAQRRRARDWSEEEARRAGRRFVVAGGLLLPGISVAVILAFGIPIGNRLLPQPLAAGAPEPLRIVVTARQWQWEVRYPETGEVLFDELHLPAGRPADVQVRSEDVIHSFWVPRLHGKIDAVPGRTHVVRLLAEAPGEMGGQCAEFCGRDHAHMVLAVRVHPAEVFERRLAEAAAAGRPPRQAAVPAETATEVRQ